MQNKMCCHLMCELNSQRKDCPTAGLLSPEGKKAGLNMSNPEERGIIDKGHHSRRTWRQNAQKQQTHPCN